MGFAIITLQAAGIPKLTQVFIPVLQNDNLGHSTSKIFPLFLFSLLYKETGPLTKRKQSTALTFLQLNDPFVEQQRTKGKGTAERCSM